jgi:hypothetical protein
MWIVGNNKIFVETKQCFSPDTGTALATPPNVVSIAKAQAQRPRAVELITRPVGRAVGRRKKRHASVLPTGQRWWMSAVPAIRRRCWPTSNAPSRNALAPLGLDPTPRARRATYRVASLAPRPATGVVNRGGGRRARF